jgi:MoxR-like ATPase
VITTQGTAPLLAEKASRLIDQVETVIIGKRHVVEMIMTAVLCSGHVLIEDIPGVGKTTLAKSFARVLGCIFKRVQFTPDLLPADVTGTTIFNQKSGQFEFREGPVFTHVLLADEINRATPKTQSALLECMEERQVTADGITYELPHPFFVIGTENNIEAHGTYPLPDAQLDRFLMRISIGYPSKEEEIRILARQTKTTPLYDLQEEISREELLDMQREVREIYVDASIRDYIVSVVTATRTHPQVSLGASPRGSLFLLHAAQAYAGLKGRTYVLPDDVKQLAPAVLAHRIMLRPEARLKLLSAEKLIEEILQQVPVPIVS